MTHRFDEHPEYDPRVNELLRNLKLLWEMGEHDFVNAIAEALRTEAKAIAVSKHAQPTRH